MDDTHILVDPFILAVPQTPHERPEYLSHLVEWLGVLRRNRGRCSVSEASVGEMWSNGQYPTVHRLDQIVRDLGVVEFSAVDVMNLLRPVSEREPFLEHATGLRAVAMDEWTIDPEYLAARLGAGLRSTFRDAVALALFAHGRGWAVDGVLLATAEVAHEEAECRTHITLVEHLDGEVEEGDERVEGTIDLITDPHEAEADVSIQEIFDEPARAAVFVVRDVNPDRISVGTEFVQSLRSLEVLSISV